MLLSLLTHRACSSGTIDSTYGSFVLKTCRDDRWISCRLSIVID
ncbi:hypothetical protein C4K02_0304 [Pseudomonas synxantha]|nr:hypothetical protein C4K02_0304 [Pseudomonas synxantha]